MSISEHVLTRTRGKRFRIAVVSFVTVLIVVVLLVSGRGWFRDAAVPGLYGLRYDAELNETLREQVARLDNPLLLLGMKDTHDSAARCSSDSFSGLRIGVVCYAGRSGAYSTAPVQVSAFQLHVQTVLELLRDNGWKGGVVESAVSSTMIWYRYTVTSHGDDVVSYSMLARWAAVLARSNVGGKCNYSRFPLLAPKRDRGGVRAHRLGVGWPCRVAKVSDTGAGLDGVRPPYRADQRVTLWVQTTSHW